MRGITAIAFIGSVFSPYYAWARRRGSTNPANHCALNVALYEPGMGRWAMTERGAKQVSREACALSIGPSSMRWTGSALEIQIDEVCVPLPRRLRGTIRVTPETLCRQTFALDPRGLHRWTPFAPSAHVDVRFSEPSLCWGGRGYFDCNRGEEPLENAFEQWSWSRASRGQRTVVFYDTKPRGAEARSLALQFNANADLEYLDVPPAVELPRTRWRMARRTRSDEGQEVRVIRTLEDAPFYSRSLLDTAVLGGRASAIHESLSLDRFRSAWVQCMLPFRMPRIAF
jgi:carotenoid 1,2-hydratase